MVGRTGDASPVSPAVATPLYVAELVWPLALNFVSDFTYLFLVVDFWTQASLIARQLGASVCACCEVQRLALRLWKIFDIIF